MQFLRIFRSKKCKTSFCSIPKDNKNQKLRIRALVSGEQNQTEENPNMQTSERSGYHTVKQFLHSGGFTKHLKNVYIYKHLYMDAFTPGKG